MTKYLSLVSALTLTASSVAAQPADTTRISRQPLFTAKDAWIAAAFVGGSLAMYPADRYLARKLQSPGNQENRFLKDVASEFRFMGTPGSMIVGVSMYGVGRIAKVDRMADLGLHGAEALIVAQQIVGLVDNAIKHSPSGGTVTIALVRVGMEYHITVADHGAGIPPDAQANVFERFFRVDMARSREYADDAGGAGLGLAIARWIAEAHDGRLELVKSNERGTEFRLTLPVENGYSAP